MREYATRDATVKVLMGLGFTQVADSDFFDSPNSVQGIPVVQAYIYQCRNGYYCVDLDGGFRAPCVWDGPKADWDDSDTTEDFVKWLNDMFPDWKGGQP